MFAVSSGRVRVTSRVEWHPDEIVDDPTISEILDAVARLDGETYSMVSVDWREPDRDAHSDDAITSMVVCGGDRVAVSYIVRDAAGEWDQDFAFLAQPERGESREERVCGGQETAFRARWWVDRPLAERALRHFASTGEADPRLIWEHDPDFRRGPTRA